MSTQGANVRVASEYDCCLISLEVLTYADFSVNGEM